MHREGLLKDVSGDLNGAFSRRELQSHDVRLHMKTLDDDRVVLGLEYGRARSVSAARSADLSQSHVPNLRFPWTAISGFYLC